jgi:hypothetical protein
MATRTPAVTYNPNGNRGVVQVVWTGLLNTDVGGAVELPNYADRSLQLTGTLGSGGAASIEGSNDGTNWHELSDAEGDQLLLDEASEVRNVMELTRYIRPNITTGDGSTSLTVTMTARKQTF